MYVRYTQGQNEEYLLSGICTKPCTYYRGWFTYMRYTQGQNEECLLSRSMYDKYYTEPARYETCMLRFFIPLVYSHSIE